jgi:hypothetical protein
MKTRLLICGVFAVAATGLFGAEPLTQSTFTEVIKDVNVVAQPTKTATPAKANELFKFPDLIRTGSESRAELTAADKTITRVGANSVFSFEPAGRDINLQQGSVLFHSPTGKGGGTIKSGGASAAVLGTTLIVATTPVQAPTDRNGFKVILLEGKGRVTLPNGRSRTLNGGQMVYVLPGQTQFGPVLDINLGKLVAGSPLVTGFSAELLSMPKIKKAIERQDDLIRRGRAKDTGVSADNFPKQRSIPGNGANGIDNNTYILGTLQPAFVFSPKAGGPPIIK